LLGLSWKKYLRIIITLKAYAPTPGTSTLKGEPRITRGEQQPLTICYPLWAMQAPQGRVKPSDLHLEGHGLTPLTDRGRGQGGGNSGGREGRFGESGGGGGAGRRAELGGIGGARG
jgi:hypothetical protein